MTYDVIVIGAGPAGLVAAARAASLGSRTVVLAAGTGSLGYQTGGIDLYGGLQGGLQGGQDDGQDGGPDPLSAVEALVRGQTEYPHQTEHPYRLAGMAAILDALTFFEDITGDSRLGYARPERGNHWLPTALGTWRPTYLAPGAQLAGERGLTEGGLVVGIRELPDFQAALAAAELTRQSGRPGTWGHVEISLGAVLPGRATVNALELAHAFDRGLSVQALADALSDASKDYPRVGFPAVLGLDSHPEVYRELQVLLGKPVFEIPTLPPSVPGLRLERALRQRLKKMEVEVITGFPVQFDPSRGWPPSEVITHAHSRRNRYRGHSFVLATGGVAGGGLEVTPDAVLEKVFGFPTGSAPRVLQRSSERIFDPGGHALARLGIRVNEWLQPLDDRGQVLADNVFVAGRLLGSQDPNVERCGSGVALVSGFFAGTLAAAPVLPLAVAAGKTGTRAGTGIAGKTALRGGI